MDRGACSHILTGLQHSSPTPLPSIPPSLTPLPAFRLLLESYYVMKLLPGPNLMARAYEVMTRLIPSPPSSPSSSSSERDEGQGPRAVTGRQPHSKGEDTWGEGAAGGRLESTRGNFRGHEASSRPSSERVARQGMGYETGRQHLSGRRDSRGDEAACLASILWMVAELGETAPAKMVAAAVEAFYAATAPRV